MSSDTTQRDSEPRCNPVLAAFRIGRLIARLGYLAQQCWLGGTRFEMTIGQCTEELRTAALAMPPCELKYDLANTFMNWNSHWSRMFSGEERLNFIEGLSPSYGQEGIEPATARMAALPVIELIGDLWQCVQAFFDQTGNAALRLGWLLEQARCRSDILSVLLTEDISTVPVRPLMVLDFLEPGEAPKPGWQLDVQSACGDLGFHVDGLMPSDFTSAVIAADAVERLAHQIEGKLLDSFQSPSETSAAEMRAGYLGLQLDSGRRVASICGLKTTVDFSDDQLSWAILNCFQKSGDSYTARKVIRDLWDGCGRAKNPAYGTVDAQISTLRGKLKPLGLVIESQRRVGWRLAPRVNEQLPLNDS